MSEENKTIFTSLLTEAFNKGNLAILDELVAPNHVNHTDNIRGPEEYKQFITMFRTAFPDLHFTIEDQLAEGDKALHRWVATGTHQGELMGIPPTGKQIRITGMFVGRIVDGKIVEEWGNWDKLGMLQQLGAIPPMG
jgi:steroid delta-isomerase-like uncharacterized protein